MKLLFLISFILTPSTIIAQNINQFDTDGKRHGIWKKTFENTKILRYEGEFFHGKEVGTFKFYKNIKNKAVLAVTKQFNENDNIAVVTFYNTKGKAISEGKMHGKTYIGTWKYYNIQAFNQNDELLMDFISGTCHKDKFGIFQLLFLPLHL